MYSLEDSCKAYFFSIDGVDFEVICQRNHVREKLDFACASHKDIKCNKLENHCASLQRIFLDFDFRFREKLLGNVYCCVKFPCSVDVGYEDLGSLQVGLQFVNELLKLCVVDMASLLLFYFRCGNGM